jgi:sortase A
MISRLLFLLGIVCLGLYAFFTLQAFFHQRALERQLEEPLKVTASVGRTRLSKPLQEGDLFGKLEIPRLNMSVMVMEGDEDDILRLGAGHIPGTALAIAGHRDTFFRPLKDIQPSDQIRLTTPQGTTEYRVVSTRIVGPKDISVLRDASGDRLTLITCYPFYYIGPAPKRFIVEAVKSY